MTSLQWPRDFNLISLLLEKNKILASFSDKLLYKVKESQAKLMDLSLYPEPQQKLMGSIFHPSVVVIRSVVSV